MRLIVLTFACALAGCSPFNQEEQRIAEAKEAVALKMKDPASATFRNVRICPDSSFSVTGEVNAKNSFGAYSGYTQFWASGLIVNMADDFDGVTDWRIAQAALDCEGSTMAPEARKILVNMLPEEMREFY